MAPSRSSTSNWGANDVIRGAVVMTSPFLLRQFLPRPRPVSQVRRSNELHRDASETAEIGVQRVALAREDHARERAGEHDMAGFERHAVGAEFVGEPGD